MTDREIIVHVDLEGESRLAGRLWSRVRGGRESASFEYDRSWLENPRRFALEPALALASAPFHTCRGKALFAAMGDSVPDRWGRALMCRAEIRRAQRKRETPRALFDADILLLADDEARQGALRFKADPKGPFLAQEGGKGIPPLAALPRLLAAAERVSRHEEDDEDLRLLLAPGSCLGGTRPKACVRDSDGTLMLAKFPQPGDDFDVVLWEGVALSLAAKAGVETPDWRIERIGDQHVILIRRFDRDGAGRIPFLSAMAMLDASDHEPRSYLEIADALRQHGGAAKADLIQLWRRIAFGVLVSNTDDHLRNHGFLRRDHAGWRLSPAYDINPVPSRVRARILSTSISADDPAASIALALDTAGHYGLRPEEARDFAAQAAQAVSGWRGEAARLGVAADEIGRMASAFEHEDLEIAGKMA